jgi:hypothetical protein
VIYLILHDDRFVGEVILVLHAQQTFAEQAMDKTITGNGIGFSAANAPRFGQMARKLLRGRVLSSGDLLYCREILNSGRPRLGKHRGQILTLLGLQAPRTTVQENRMSEVRQ